MNRFLPAICAALWVAFAGWAATIIYLSSLSGANVEELNVFHLWDKLAHFAAFAAGGFLLAGALRAATQMKNGRILVYTIFLLALFAASDEWHQLYTPGRSGSDVRDWISDVLGTAFGAALAIAFGRVTRWRQRV